jgi:hypothetical protein
MTLDPTSFPTNRFNEYSPEFCMCESSYCDHPDSSCDRDPSQYVWCEYVIEICSTCAANMCISGGQEYIHLIEEASQTP